MPTRTAYAHALPAFVADRDSLTHDGGHQIDWANVGEQYRMTAGQIITVGTGGAAAAATAIPVAALVGPVAAGTLLDFTGTGELARVTSAAAVGATSLAVEALDAGVEEGDTATVAGSGSKFLPAGTVCGELLGAGKISPRVASTNPASCILATDAIEDSRVAARSGYGVILGGVIYENLLPDAAGDPAVLPTAFKTELNANGTGFAFRQYSDSSAA